MTHVRPNQYALIAQLALIPMTAKILPRRDTRPPSSQSRSGLPKRRCCNNFSRQCGAPLPKAHAPIIRKMVVGRMGTKAFTNPIDVLSTPSARQSKSPSGIPNSSRRAIRWSGGGEFKGGSRCSESAVCQMRSRLSADVGTSVHSSVSSVPGGSV